MYMGAIEWNNLEVWLRRVEKYEEFKLHQKRWMGSLYSYSSFNEICINKILGVSIMKALAGAVGFPP